MKEIKYGTQFYTVSVRTFVISYYGLGSGNVINYGPGSVAAKVRN
jgi:hypothetical protein